MPPSKTTKKPSKTAQIKAEITKLKDLLGPMETEEQVATASHLHALMDYSGKHEIEEAAIHQYISEGDMASKRWQEIETYRLIHQTSTYFTEGQPLGDEETGELGLAIQYWSSLLCERALGPLVMSDTVFAAKTRLENGEGSAAELFREFVRLHKWQHNIDQWDRDSMFGLRSRIYKVVSDFLDGRKLKIKAEEPESTFLPRPWKAKAVFVSSSLFTILEIGPEEAPLIPTATVNGQQLGTPIHDEVASFGAAAEKRKADTGGLFPHPKIQCVRS